MHYLGLDGCFRAKQNSPEEHNPLAIIKEYEPLNPHKLRVNKPLRTIPIYAPTRNISTLL